MTEQRAFKDVKFQWLSLITQDSRLSTTAIAVAVYIVTTHYNPEKDCAWPSYGTIAEAMGKNAKTIQRAIKELEQFWLTVKRGNGLGHSTIFSPSKGSIHAASELREKQDKIVPLRPSKGGQNCPERVTNLSEKGGQNCPPNKEIEKIKEKRNVTARKLKPFPKVFVEQNSRSAEAWERWLKERDLPTLDNLRPQESRYGITGFYLPSSYPPSHSQEGYDMEKHLLAQAEHFSRKTG